MDRLDSEGWGDFGDPDIFLADAGELWGLDSVGEKEKTAVALARQAQAALQAVAMDEQLVGKSEEEEALPQPPLASARDRNREYARNTRLRKKAYVRDLEETVRSMRGEQSRRRRTEQRDEDSKRTRLKIIRQFLEYRGRGEVSEAAWAEIVDSQTFELRLPVTPYRSYDPAEVEDVGPPRRTKPSGGLGGGGGGVFFPSSAAQPQPPRKCASASSFSSSSSSSLETATAPSRAARTALAHLSGARRVCRGIRGLIYDTASFAVMLQSIGVPERRGHELVRCSFELLDGGDASHEVLFSPSRVLGSWRMRTVNASSVGATGEVEKRGMLEAWFTDDDKLKRIDLCFDVLAFTRELQRCRGGVGPDLLELVPNTLKGALRELRRDDDVVLRWEARDMARDMAAFTGVLPSTACGGPLLGPLSPTQSSTKRRKVVVPKGGHDDAMPSRRPPYSGGGGGGGPLGGEDKLAANNANGDRETNHFSGGYSSGCGSGSGSGSGSDEESRRRKRPSSSLFEERPPFRRRPRVIAVASRPHAITHVNRAFLELTHFRPEETIGQSLTIMHGPATDVGVVEDFLADVDRKIPTSMIVVNYTRNNDSFINYLRVYPLFADATSSKVTHFLGELERVDDDTVLTADDQDRDETDAHKAQKRDHYQGQQGDAAGLWWRDTSSDQQKREDKQRQLPPQRQPQLHPFAFPAGGGR